MLNISVLNVTTLTANRPEPAGAGAGMARRYAALPEKNAAISIVTPVLQPVFSLRLCPAGGGGRALLAKPLTLAREY